VAGGAGLDIPTDSHRQMQKVFRWIDGDTEYAANNIRQLAPAIMSVLPLEYRNRLAPQNDTMSLIASAMKECAEAKQAVLLDARASEAERGKRRYSVAVPPHAGASRAADDDGDVDAGGYVMGSFKMAKAGLRQQNWLSGAKTSAVCRRNNGKKSTLLPYRCT
jgi:hypothetical protein